MRRWVSRIATLLLALAVLGASHPKDSLKGTPPPPPEALDPPDASNGYNYGARQKKAVEMVQRTSARAIDSTAADTSFGAWFRQVVGPDAKISWELNDCGETQGWEYPPSCVQATAEWYPEHRATIIFVVGSLETGEDEQPWAFYVGADRGDSTQMYRSLAEFKRSARPFAEP